MGIDLKTVLWECPDCANSGVASGTPQGDIRCPTCDPARLHEALATAQRVIVEMTEAAHVGDVQNLNLEAENYRLRAELAKSERQRPCTACVGALDPWACPECSGTRVVGSLR